MSDEPDPVTIEKTGGTLIARPRVKLMDDEALQLLARLIDEASGDPTGEAAGGAAPVPLVVIDLSRVAIVPSLALGSLVIIHNKCKARQQKLKLAGLQPQIRRVFTITKLDHVFELADTVETAIA